MTGARATAPDEAQTGGREAFRMLVEQHGQKMFRLAFRMTGNAEDAEDVVQETFLRAYGKFARFESRAHVSSWLHRIAANYAIDLLRRRKRWRMQPADDTGAGGVVLAAEDPGPDRRVFGIEIQERLARALETLSPRERVAFVLRHHEGASIEEIGQHLGTRTSATKNYIFRAVRKLRAVLGPMRESNR